MAKLSQEEIRAEIEKSEGKIFSVKFIKRTTGEERHMLCRIGVVSYLKGGKLSYDPKEKNLVTVFDMVKKAYRSIPIESIFDLKIKGQALVDSKE